MKHTLAVKSSKPRSIAEISVRRGGRRGYLPGNCLSFDDIQKKLADEKMLSVKLTEKVKK